MQIEYSLLTDNLIDVWHVMRKHLLRDQAGEQRGSMLCFDLKNQRSLVVGVIEETKKKNYGENMEEKHKLHDSRFHWQDTIIKLEKELEAKLFTLDI